MSLIRVAVSAFQENDLPSSPHVTVHVQLNNLRLKNSRTVASFLRNMPNSFIFRSSKMMVPV